MITIINIFKLNNTHCCNLFMEWPLQ